MVQDRAIGRKNSLHMTTVIGLSNQQELMVMTIPYHYLNPWFDMKILPKNNFNLLDF